VLNFYYVLISDKRILRKQNNMHLQMFHQLGFTAPVVYPVEISQFLPKYDGRQAQ
jgi:hypothetical protein